MKLNKLVGFASFMVLTSLGYAADKSPENYQGHVRLDKYHEVYDVNKDGTYVETVERIVSVLDDQGIEAANQASIAYSASMNSMEIVEAGTLKPNGTKVPVKQSNIQVSKNTGMDNKSPIITDIESTSVIFPEVSVGDKVFIKYKVIAKEPQFKNQFAIAPVFIPTTIALDTRFETRIPVEMEVKTEARGVTVNPVVEENGKRVYSWSYTNDKIVKTPGGQVSYFDYAPRFVISSFKSYEDIAEAYASRMLPKLVVSDRVKKIAEAAVAEEKAVTEREKAQAINNWITSNIKYLENNVGVGSVVPHDIDLILDNKLGDCKDHALLTEAMLSAVGIESTQSLISLSNIFTIPDTPYSGSFNHIINYIPSLDLYVDSTAEKTPFGLLPNGDYDKSTLHITISRGIHKTPKQTGELQKEEVYSKIKVNPDGTATGTTMIKDYGLLAVRLKNQMEDMRPDMVSETVKSWLDAAGFEGEGAIVEANPVINDKTGEVTFVMVVKYSIENMLNLPGPEALAMYSPIGSLGSIASALDTPKGIPYSNKVVCSGGHSTSIVEIEFPENVVIMNVPKDKTYSRDVATYTSKYKKEGQTVTAMRELVDVTEGNTCEATQMEELRKLSSPVLKDLRSKIIYSVKE